MSDPPPPAPIDAVSPYVVELLRTLDQDRCNLMLAAFNRAAVSIHATNPEALYAVAMLQAQVLARANYGEEQIWVAKRFAELVRLTLPGAMMQVEQAKRAHDGRPFDA